MTITSYIILLAAALIDLCAMLRWDASCMRENDYSQSSYYNLLRTSGELTSLKRLLVLAVLIATCTTMAQMSWIVVILLAAVLVAQGIALLFSRQVEKTGKRGTALIATGVVITLLLAGAAYGAGRRTAELDGIHAAAITAVMVLAVSPLLTMLCNWLLRPRQRRG